ncbi:hypothetical protein GIX45_28110 [Erwinia sp. CPCC 100877]|nr:hypothetical protein [Erwinia sp. CPCC 100877]
MKPKLKRILNILGNIITLIAIYFVFKKLFSSPLDYNVLLEKQNIMIILVITVVLSIIIITNCFPWKLLVEIFSTKKIPWRDSIQVYTKSNLLKYLPGNVFQYVGRNELASRQNISHLQVASATVFDIIINVMAAVLLSSIYFFQNKEAILSANKQNISFILISGVALALGLTIIVFIFKSKITPIFAKIKSLLTRKTLKGVVISLIYYMFTMMIQSLLFILLLIFVLNIELNFDLFLKLFSAYTFSWLVGFITPGAPAGIGIREAVMAGATGGLVNQGTITFAMVIFRVLTTFADIIAFSVVSFYNYLTNKYQRK